MDRCWRAAALAAVAVLVSSGARAAQADFEIVRDHVDYDVAADGSFVEKQEKIFRILSPQGLEALHEVVLQFTQSYQDGSIDEAYTLKRDGRRIPVPRNRYFEAYGLTENSGFRDQKTKVAVFEDVEVGDEVGYVTVFRQTKPWYPGQFFTSFLLTPKVPLHDFEVSVNAPASIDLQTDARGLSGGPKPAGDSMHRWQWVLDTDRTSRNELSGVSGYDQGAYLAVSTFKDFAALARAYAVSAAGKAQPTNDVRTIADRLTTGITDRRMIAERLYDWVSANIKYVALVQGDGALVPHSAAEVLSSRYGDCKDHVTLLEALLKAKGIDSSPVLINLDQTYQLPSVASPELFNHLISYIPDFHIYLDSTAKFVPFGVLPPGDLDKPVLLVASGKQARTPGETANASSVRTASAITVHDDGSAEGDSQFSATGSLAAGLRETLAGVDALNGDTYIRENVPGAAGGALSQSSAASDPFSGSAHYRLDNAANFQGPGAISFAVGYRPRTVRALLDASLPDRRDAYVCPSFSDTEETTITLPKDVEITFVPKAAEASAEGVSLTTRYERLSDNAVRATVSLKVEHPHMTCSAEYYNRVHASLNRMLGLLGAQVVYRPSTALEREASIEPDYAPCAARKCSSQ